MQENVTRYWPIFFSLTSILVSLIAQWAILGTRITAIEGRQDRQGAAITTIQDQVARQAADYAALAAKIDSINDNVNYIRSRIDRVTQ